MSSSQSSSPGLYVDRALALAPDLQAAARDTELDRRLAPALVARMAEAELFRLCVPAAIGGVEADAATIVRVLEAVAAADGAAGWTLMIGATTGLVAAYLPLAEARAIYGSDPLAVTGGVFAPRGKAERRGDVYVASGRWPFASGCGHCTWLMGGCIITEDGELVRDASGAPEARMLVFPATDAVIHDTWKVSGLRGTGSHDIEISELVVPVSRAVSLVSDRPLHDGTLYEFPVFGMLAIGIAAVALGIARGAIDDILSLAPVKSAPGSRRKLSERAVVQAEVARAEAEVASARAWLLETIGQAERAAASGALDAGLRARVRLSATHTVGACKRAVDAMYEVGGGGAIYEDSALQRRFRDVHTITQHMMVAGSTWELAGRVLLGVDTNVSQL